MTPGCADYFIPLREALNDSFYPALLGGPVSEHDVCLFALPTRFGGLGISDPVKSALLAFSSSHEVPLYWWMLFMVWRSFVWQLIWISWPGFTRMFLGGMAFVS